MTSRGLTQIAVGGIALLAANLMWVWSVESAFNSAHGVESAQADSAPPGLLPIRSCQLHDLDTLTKCDIVLAWDVALVNQSIRLHGVDALEVSRTRKTVDITDDEIVRGKEGLAKLASLSDGAKWFVRPTGNSVYGRREGELYFRSRSGKWIDVAEWIRTNGYERGKQ